MKTLWLIAGALLFMGCGTAPTIVRYNVAGFGAARIGDYTARPRDIDKFLAAGTNCTSRIRADSGWLVATLFHRGRTLSLVSPTNSPSITYDLVVVEDGKPIMIVPDGACNLSFMASDNPLRRQLPTKSSNATSNAAPSAASEVVQD